MALSKKPYKGTRDFFPDQKRIQDYIFSIMHKTSQSFTFEHFDGPLLEEVDLYSAKSGEELINDQIYSFYDRGERFVAIRPEMTPTVARMVSQVHKNITKPIRWYSIPNVYRYEKPQRGRLREHWQLNCDIFGATDRYGEIEIIQLAIQLMKNFGASEKEFEILINDRQIVDHVFKNLMNLADEKVHRLYKVVDKAKKVPREAIEKMVNEIDISEEAQTIFYQYLDLKDFDKLSSFLKSHNFETNFLDLIETLRNIGLDKYLTYDPTIVRGLDYYTGIVFEIFDKHPDNRRAICGGGAYANLLQIFNEDPLPGVGFGMGDVTLTDFLQTHELLPENIMSPDIHLLMTVQDTNALPMSLTLATNLRDQGLDIATEYNCLKFKKVFSLAEKKGAQFVSFMGEDEINSNQIQIKNMKTRDQKNFDLTNVTEIVNFLKS